MFVFFGGGGAKFCEKYFFTNFYTFAKGYLVELFGNFWDTSLAQLALGLAGPNLVALTTSDPWVGLLKFRWLDILEFAWLHAGGSGLTGKNTRNLKKSKKMFIM
jgi:hypothetical protein